jgi:FMN-dependent oxidoreductase (nitrilotriacetate monooxygenase family)
MALVAFLQAQNCSNFPGSWRHPATAQDFLDPAYYQRIGRVLEAGKFHLAFFDDRLAIPSVYGNRVDETIEHGIRAVKMDPTLLLSVMGCATERLGLGGTYSTTYYEPFHVARVFSTLDQMTRGRAAWNIVTSLNNSEAANYGAFEILDHDLRYERADEFVETVIGHWGTWDADALVLDRTGRFADPAKVRPLGHEGRWFKSAGPFTVPPSAQGYPVLIQAGQSGRGKQFSARWAELAFVIYPNFEMAKRSYREFKQAVAALGRAPDRCRIATACYAVTAETAAEAEDKKAFIDGLAKPIDGLVLLSEVLNFDFSTKGLDESFSEDEMASISGIQAFRDRVVALSGKSNPTVRDFVTHTGRGTLAEFPTFVGSPKQVADEMERWFVEGAVDGFVLAATHMPGSYEDFVRLVVPELQRRGLFRRDYAGATLRENLGLEIPSGQDWRPN